MMERARDGGICLDEKPIVNPPLSSTEIITEVIALIGLVLPIIYIASIWTTIPAIVPTHFGISGQANAWGGKESLLVLVGISFFIYIVLTVSIRFPQANNFPWPITEQNIEVQYKLVRLMLQMLKAEVIWIFAYINWISIQGAFDKGMDLGNSFLIVVLLSVFGTVGVYFWKAFRAR